MKDKFIQAYMDVAHRFAELSFEKINSILNSTKDIIIKYE